MSVNLKDGPHRRLKGHERRQRIVAAARELFADRNYDSVSIGDIAAAAGVSRPVLYDHFDSKKTLVLALLTEETEALLARIGTQIHKEASPESRIKSALEAYFEFLRERPLAPRMLRLDSTTDVDIADAGRQMRELAYAGIAALIKPQNQSASPGSADKFDMAVTVLVSAVIGLAEWWLDHPDVTCEELVAAAMELLWPGIRLISE